jgi:hypothetical protein
MPPPQGKVRCVKLFTNPTLCRNCDESLPYNQVRGSQSEHPLVALYLDRLRCTGSEINHE